MSPVYSTSHLDISATTKQHNAVVFPAMAVAVLQFYIFPDAVKWSMKTSCDVPGWPHDAGIVNLACVEHHQLLVAVVLGINLTTMAMIGWTFYELFHLRNFRSKGVPNTAHEDYLVKKYNLATAVATAFVLFSALLIVHVFYGKH